MSYKNIPDPKSINLQTDNLELLSEVERDIALDSARLKIETRTGGELRTYMVSLELIDDDPAMIQESLQELGSLIRSLGDDCVGVTVQKRSKITPATYIGSGKAEEIKASATELRVDYVAFDKELSPSQVRNLEKIIGRPVLDRTGIILQIFRRNAKTRESKTQVEIAHLQYLAPRLENAWIAYERQRGGSGGAGSRVRGAGETQIELDRRRMRDKQASLRKELERIQKERATQRKMRTEEFNVVLVGYTNAGKTTIMNGLTDSKLSAKNALFETLDSAVRVLKNVSHPKILLTDTVGFIRDLPHSLVASFRSTLEETAHADLLLHVVDVSHRYFKDHIRVTEDVLKDVGAGEVPMMYIFNKVDEIKGEPRFAKILMRGYKDSIAIAASREDDIESLREHIVNFFDRNMIEVEIRVPYQDSAKMGVIYAHTKVLETKWEDDEVIFKIRTPRNVYERYFENQDFLGEKLSDEGPL